MRDGRALCAPAYTPTSKFPVKRENGGIWARELLLNSPLKIQEIAQRCGYQDQHYFSYCYKKYSGTSPVALRRARAAGEARP